MLYQGTKVYHESSLGDGGGVGVLVRGMGSFQGGGNAERRQPGLECRRQRHFSLRKLRDSEDEKRSEGQSSLPVTEEGDSLSE